MDEEVKKTSGEPESQPEQAADTKSNEKEDKKDARKEPESHKKEKKDSKKLAEQLEAVTAERDALRQKLDEARDAHLRTLAEYDNNRKRTAREHDEIYPNATANAVAQFLPALDAFERGMSVKCTDESFH